MSDVLLVLLPWLFSMATCVAVVVWDRRRLSPAQRARGWNNASFASAVFAFAPLCIVAYFWVTRRSLKGVLLGVAWLGALLASQLVFNIAMGWLLER